MTAAIPDPMPAPAPAAPDTPRPASSPITGLLQQGTRYVAGLAVSALATTKIWGAVAVVTTLVGHPELASSAELTQFATAALFSAELAGLAWLGKHARDGALGKFPLLSKLIGKLL